MEADLAAKIMYADKDADTLREKAAEYKELQSSPMSAARRGYVDTIIQPADTRKYVIARFEMLFTKREDRRTRNTARFSEVRRSEEKNQFNRTCLHPCSWFYRVQQVRHDRI